MKINSILTEAPNGELQRFWVVYNPQGEGYELGDIMFEASPEEFIFWAKGMQEDPRNANVKIYADEWFAHQDAKRRLQQR